MVAARDYKAILRKGVFFKGLREEHLELIAGLASTVHFKKNKLIAEEGEEANDFFIIRKGRIAVVASAPQRRPLLFQTLGVGEVCGWSWLLPPYRWTFDLVALEDTTVLAIDGKRLRKACELDPSLGYDLAKRLGRIVIIRLQEARQKVIECYSKEPPEKTVIL